MSTNRECEIVQITPDTWYYLLETAQSALFDNWREMALCHGPFPGEVHATEHLRAHQPNPGGHTVLALEPDQASVDLDDDPLLQDAIEEAIAPDPRCCCWACANSPSGE